MTPAMSNPSEEIQLDVTVGACKRLLEQAYTRYNDAVVGGAASVASYWDGYIRGIQHVLAMQEE
jgi:hypothetical protein